MSVGALKDWVSGVTGERHETLEIQFVDTVEEFWAGVTSGPQLFPATPARRRRRSTGTVLAINVARALPLVLLVPELLLI